MLSVGRLQSRFCTSCSVSLHPFCERQLLAIPVAFLISVLICSLVLLDRSIE